MAMKLSLPRRREPRLPGRFRELLEIPGHANHSDRPTS